MPTGSKPKSKGLKDKPVTTYTASSDCAHRHVKRSGNRRSMPGLPGQMEVEPSAARMGTLHRGIQFLTVATAFLGNCLGSFLDGSSNIRIPGDHRGAAASSTFSDYSLDQDFGADLDKTSGPIRRERGRGTSRQTIPCGTCSKGTR